MFLFQNKSLYVVEQSSSGMGQMEKSVLDLKKFQLNFLEHNYMKVVISKSGLAVSVPKNANISGIIRAMRNTNLALCRRRLELSCHIKI